LARKEKDNSGLNETPKEKVLRLANKRLKRCVDNDNENRANALEDLRFLNGEQWDEKEVKLRKRRKRPCLQINLLPKYVDQIVGEERINRPRIKIRPVDSKADVHLARIREGIVRNIEYLSRAEQIYDQAFEMAVSCGYGAWRICTRYTEENPFIQEIYEEAIKNPFLVYLDPDCKDDTFADAKYGFVLQRMPREEFDERWPNAQYPTDSLKTGLGISNEMWYDDNTVTVAEYFTRETEKKKMAQFSDGMVVPFEEAQEAVAAWEAKAEQIRAAIAAKAAAAAAMQPPAAAVGSPPTFGPDSSTAAVPQVGAEPQGAIAGDMAAVPPTAAPPAPPADAIIEMTIGPKPEIAKTKDTEIIKIRRYIINGADVIEGMDGDEKYFPGKYIPIVLVLGKERNIEGKRYVRGMIRDAKDPQRLVNYWETSCAETVAIAPKAPWLVTAAMIKGYENDYATAHEENFPYLKYNIDPNSPMQTPIRNHAGDPPMALFAQRQSAHENLKQVIGMFAADVGAPGPERSAPAIIARQTPGDVGTFAFLDNLSRSIAHSGRIINEMIPEVYDTERDVRLRNVDESETFVPINTTAGGALQNIRKNPNRYFGLDPNKLQESIRKSGPDARFNDITIGKYDVIVSVGPSYTTQRQEASQNMFTLMNSMPDKMGVGVDILVENMDFPGSERLAARLRKGLPPALLEARPGDPPIKPQPPPIQVQVQMKKLELENKKISVQIERQKVEQIKAVKELSDAKGEVRNVVLGLLKEVMGPDHPADAAIQGGPPQMTQ
jgi:hypothetical protein